MLGADEQLANDRARGCGRGTRVLRAYRHVAPADHLLALLLDRPLQQRLDSLASLLLGGQEAHHHSVATRRRQLKASYSAQQLVGHLHQDPGPVAGQRICSGGATVLEVLERRERAHHDLMSGPVVKARDHADPARVVLVAGVVESSGL